MSGSQSIEHVDFYLVLIVVVFMLFREHCTEFIVYIVFFYTQFLSRGGNAENADYVHFWEGRKIQ